MQKFLIPLAALAVVALAFSVATADHHEKHEKDKKAGHDHAAKLGEAAPSFSLQDQTGKTHTLSDYAGKVVVLEWFNNDCPYVVKHYSGGAMNATAKKYADKDVVWLAINTTSGKSSDDNKAIAADWKIDRPILSDSTTEVAKAYQSKATPTMYIIDKEGKLVYWGAIDSDNSPDAKKIEGATNYVAKALDEVLAGKPVSEPKTKPYGCGVKYKS
ncbi:MAG: thioredoxin family protein [Tepidisphaeraceae bacterium]